MTRHTVVDDEAGRSVCDGQPDDEDVAGFGKVAHSSVSQMETDVVDISWVCWAAVHPQKNGDGCGKRKTNDDDENKIGLNAGPCGGEFGGGLEFQLQ